MFPRLKHKFVLTLSSAVIVFLLFFFIFSGVYTIRLVKNDIWQKTSQMQAQYSKSIEFKLLGLEEFCVFILQNEEMHNALLSQNTPYISNQLHLSQTTNDDILGLCVVDIQGNCYASDSLYAALPGYIFGKDYLAYLKDNVFKKSWFIADIPKERTNNLFPSNLPVFLLPIRINSEIAGYLFLHCSARRLMDNFDYADNRFLSGFSMILSDSDSYITLVSSSTATSSLYSEFPFETYKNLSVIYRSPKIILANDFAFLALIWGIAFLLFILFGFWWIKTYINSIILPLEGLYSKMSDYIEIQKNKISKKE